jgi:hypothetical protein
VATSVAEEDQQWNLFPYFLHSEKDMLAIEIDVDFNHRRSETDFINNPTAFLVSFVTLELSSASSATSTRTCSPEPSPKR